uniref:Uncharacterized protein n=1 Tax=Nelumbo nucifera TaxID=4432 RepID=A0A822Z824_NELNU|nr:TPA_asm: hypothetical protein HUJ06_015330 [Nelumbo nucifera]
MQWVPISSRGLQHKAGDARRLKLEGCLSLSSNERTIRRKRRR